MKQYTPRDIEILTNWDGLLCKPPWKNEAQKRQYYSRHITRMLWRYFTKEDWRIVASMSDDLRIPEKLKRTTKFLAKCHINKTYFR